MKFELSRQTSLRHSEDGANKPGDLWKSAPETGDLLPPAKDNRLLDLKMDVTLTLEHAEEC